MKTHPAVVLLLATFVLSASVPESKPPAVNDIDALIEGSYENMSRLTVVSAKVDAVVKETVVEMREQIEVLEEANKVLVQEKEALEVMVELAQDAYNEVIIKRDSAPTKQFDILAILSDSTNRG